MTSSHPDPLPSARKVDRGEPAPQCPVTRGEDGVWRIRGYLAGRAALRGTGTVQAGLGIETMDKLPARIRRPVLYRDGPEHREHRRQTARFFTAKHVDEHYLGTMARIADEQLARLRQHGRADLSELSFGLAVAVAKSVVGLTESRPGTERRLNRFFPDEFGQPGFTSLRGLYWFGRQLFSWVSFYLNDVRPSVRPRRRVRRDDLISHLVDEGCTDGEILGECLTIAAAGMVTTREFINVAAWHLFTDEDLRARYLDGDETTRFAVLHELLRLEPVVGNLVRRTTEPLELPDGTRVPAGELVDIAVAEANLDPAVMGPDPRAVCPARPTGAGTGPAGLTFGDGPHRCPGTHVAVRESDIFLSKLFAEPGLRMASPPRVRLQPAISGYELRGLVVTVEG
ncbi:cytochrome P450 [Crossiella equi]|uniref:Cytochrome P450 n=1 Tax=Crossiella equi TaxID=130796 RepID=A0ABS5A6U5_9PSEU|nr:cytochrome P450 [Crossiella equi]MBP2472318.1 cytochrome P450 [Crossiella equi]